MSTHIYVLNRNNKTYHNFLIENCHFYSCKYEPRCENQSSGFPTRSDTNWAVQPQKMARGWKFWIYVEEGLHYPCSENKGADQLCGHREADLRLFFTHICKKPVFS